jgi:hypothetical protein
MKAEAPFIPISEPRITPGALITVWELKKKKHNKHPKPDNGLPQLPPISKPAKPEAAQGQSARKRHSGHERWTLGEKRSSRHGRN